MTVVGWHRFRWLLLALVLAFARPEVAAQPGVLHAVGTTEDGVVTRGGSVSFVGGEPAYESSLIVAPPTRSAFVPAGTANAPRKIATVGRRVASLSADQNGIRLALTLADGTGESVVRVGTPGNLSSSPFVKPNGIRDLFAGTDQEEEDACYTVFSGDVLVGETEDDPVLFLLYCARRYYDDPRGVGPRTTEFNWAYDQVAILSASVDALTPDVMPDWDIQISDRVHQGQRVANTNGIGQTWAANVTENPARAGEYVVGLANYLNGPRDNANDLRGLNVVYIARAIIDGGVWSLSDWIEVDAYDGPSTSRHVHFAIPYWLGERLGVMYGFGDSKAQDPSAPFVNQTVLGRVTLGTVAETFDPGNTALVPLTGGLADSIEWRNPDGTLTGTATGFVRVGPRPVTGLSPEDTGVLGFSAAVPLHGSFFDDDLMPGLQPVGVAAAGGRVWMGADENLPAIVSFDQADFLTDAPVAEAVQGLPDWDIAFSMTTTRDGSAYAWISETASISASTQRLLWLAEGRWGTLTNPEAKLSAIGGSPSGVLINGQGVEVVSPPVASRVSRGLVGGPAVTNVAMGVPGIDTRDDPNLSIEVVSDAELAALGVPPCPLPGVTVVRVTAQSGVARDRGELTYGAVPDLGPSIVTVATYSMLERQSNEVQMRMYAWDGSTAVPFGSREQVRGETWATGGWQLRRFRTAGDSLGALGGTDVSPRLAFRWSGFQPALFAGDFLAAVAITPAELDDPASSRAAVPGGTVASVGLDTVFPGPCGDDWAAMVAVETGPGLQDRLVPDFGRVALLSLVGELGGSGPALEFFVDTTGNDDALLVRSADSSGAVSETRIDRTLGNAKLDWDAYAVVRFVMTSSNGRTVWMSWDGRPFFPVWSDAAAAWCPRAARLGLRDGTGIGDVRVHHAAYQTGVGLTTGDEVLAWVQRVEEALAGPACGPADLEEPFGVLTFADVSSFLAAFSSGGSDADVAPPFGQLTFADISGFVSAFVAGCP
jgi:hypothetical protein